jgi:hypothetical protein
MYLDNFFGVFLPSRPIVPHAIEYQYTLIKGLEEIPDE